MKLITSLEREGGHIAVLFILLVGCLLLSLTFPDNTLITKVGDLTLGALLLAMKGNGNRREDDAYAAAQADAPRQTDSPMPTP